jgi:hypothetical protein
MASINVQRMSVHAAITGDLDLLKLAVLHDPLVGAICTPEEVWQMVDEMVVAQAKLNPLTRRQDLAQREIDRLVAQHRKDPEATKRLDDLKETLALLSGLEAKSVGNLDHYLGLVDQILNGKRPFDRALFKNADGPVTAEQIYMNQKVSDLMSNAEMDQSDYRRGNKPNVFFGAQKRYFGVKFDVFFFNTSVLILSTLGLLGLLHWILRRELEVRRSKFHV